MIGSTWWKGKAARARALVSWSAIATRVKAAPKTTHERGRGGRVAPQPTGRRRAAASLNFAPWRFAGEGPPVVVGLVPGR